jgi:hypothetical protein
MNFGFFQQVEVILAPERLDAYRQDGVPPATTLARYLWNMALCESLYTPLQLAEIALRNCLHHFLSARFNSPAWYDVIPNLPSWQQNQLHDARQKLAVAGKNLTPGRMVAELHFGFWTGFFNKHHARTGLGHAVAANVFHHAPKNERDLRKLDIRWNRYPGFAKPRFPSRANYPLDGPECATHRPVASHPMGQPGITADRHDPRPFHGHTSARIESMA